MINVSIIIVTYNSSSVLGECISSLRSKCTTQNYEIIVVDNNSTDSEKEYLRNLSGIDTLILHSSNEGFGAANNIGSISAKGDYLLFLNPDTIILNNIVTCFLEACDELEIFGVLGAWQKNPDLSDNHSYGSFDNHRISRFIRNEFRQNMVKQCISLSGITHNRKPQQVTNYSPRTESVKERQRFTEVDWINGACLFMRKKIFIDIGCFDTRIFLFSEEVDLQRRLCDQGYYSFLVDDPQIIHLHEDKRKMENWTRIQFYRGYLVYAKKHNSSLSYFMLRISLVTILIMGSFLDLFSRRYSFTENCQCIHSLQ